MDHASFALSTVLSSCVASLLTCEATAGQWVRVTADAPVENAGVAILLSDGTVIALGDSGTDWIGDTWHRLTPDVHGSYVNGTWSSIGPMLDSREYFSSQLLMDGRLYVAGGEYGTGKSKAEVYNPLTNTWTAAANPGGVVSDANSEILPDGRVLQALLVSPLKKTRIYNPVTNTFVNGPDTLGIHNESVWVKLADDSILFVDRGATTSERYIPSLNVWQSAGTTPVELYDPWGNETGAALRLPDGRAFFLGSLGTSAYYVPGERGQSGGWIAGPPLPNGTGTPDAAMAMLVDGTVLCVVSPKPTPAEHFPHPTTFYIFNPITETYTQIPAPDGANSIDAPCYAFCLLALPDGTALCMQQGSPTYSVWVPDGAPLAIGKPTLSGVMKLGATTYQLSGMGFNGISEGASYGDDWQMNTNYPIARLTSADGSVVRYARTFNWNSTGVATGTLPTTTMMTLPAALAPGAYSLEVVANGIASDPRPFVVPSTPCAADLDASGEVDAADLAVLLGLWGSGPAASGPDLDGSGTVDAADLAQMLGGWGNCS